MAKYSTGNSSSTPDDSCQLCGTTEEPLEEIEMAGATVSVCDDCNPQQSDEKSDDDTHTGSKLPNQSKNSTDTTEQTPGYTISNRSEQSNPEWIENANYGNADTPYMQKNYETKFTHALNEEDITITDLSEETEIPIDDLKAIASGNALEQEVSHDAITVIEEFLDIELKEDI